MNSQYDPWLSFSVIALTLFGTVMIYSTSAVFAELRFQNGFHFLTAHLLHLCVGIGFFVIGLRMNYRQWEKIVPVMMITALILLVLVLIPGIGHEVKGARRWIRIFGIGFQPAEFLKVVLVFYVASYLGRKQDILNSFFRGISPNFIVIGIYLILVLMQPDFGTVVLISLTVLSMMYIGGGKPIHIFGSLVGFSLVGTLLIISQSYRLRRLSAFLDPWDDPLDSGFQIIQSFIALGTGGWFGKGLSMSLQKLFFLPDAHTDFIFAIVGEELGFIRVVFLIFLFGVFIWRGYLISLHADNLFGRHIAFGVTTSISLQILLNLFVVTGLLPTKGLPLPFISSGGTSLIVTLFMAGLLLNIGQISPAAARGASSPFSTKSQRDSGRNS
ncbi:MAG: putative lipid II flippase FtsW [SAR324 cluster bacterium]|nr:putative lipid II flippase FtsW [SAR324 cluster bacterium]